MVVIDKGREALTWLYSKQRYKYGDIAKMLKTSTFSVSQSTLCSVMKGHRSASPELERRLIALKDKISAKEAK